MMHRHVEAVFEQLRASRRQLLATLATVPASSRAQRPAIDRWSVNEVLEHIAIVDSLFAARLQRAIAAAREAGLEEETGERVPLSEAFINGLVDRSAPRNAPEPARPTGTLDSQAVMDALTRSRAALESAVSAADGLALSGVFEAHPVFGRLTIYQWIELVSGHERRHMQQVEEIVGQIARTA